MGALRQIWSTINCTMCVCTCTMVWKEPAPHSNHLFPHFTPPSGGLDISFLFFFICSLFPPTSLWLPISLLFLYFNLSFPCYPTSNTSFYSGILSLCLILRILSPTVVEVQIKSRKANENDLHRRMQLTKSSPYTKRHVEVYSDLNEGV